MTLGIAMKCRDGSLVIADKRSTKRNKAGEVTGYNDDFEKIVSVKGVLIFNYGYNQIGHRDWKESAEELFPDEDHPIYQEIILEMIQKPNQKRACYVFVSRSGFREIRVTKDGVKEKDLSNDWWIKRGDGKTFVDRNQLNLLRGFSVKGASVRLKKILSDAYEKQPEKQVSTFIKEHTIKSILK